MADVFVGHVITCFGSALFKNRAQIKSTKEVEKVSNEYLKL